jgi:hypothetical protein
MHVLTSVIRRTLALVAGALLAMATVAAIAADAPGRAAGTFRSQAIMMPVNSAMAFRGKSAFDKSDVAARSSSGSKATTSSSSFSSSSPTARIADSATTSRRGTAAGTAAVA